MELRWLISTEKGVYFVAVALYFLDVDECTSASQKCHANADCVNTHGSYPCTCKPRFIGDGHSCTGELSKGYCMLLRIVHWETTYI